MLISDMKPGVKLFTQLDNNILAVISRRYDGWCIYIGAVTGQNHIDEWQSVADNGTKVKEETAKAIAKEYFHPSFNPTGCKYAK